MSGIERLKREIPTYPSMRSSDITIPTNMSNKMHCTSSGRGIAIVHN